MYNLKSYRQHYILAMQIQTVDILMSKYFLHTVYKNIQQSVFEVKRNIDSPSKIHIMMVYAIKKYFVFQYHAQIHYTIKNIAKMCNGGGPQDRFFYDYVFRLVLCLRTHKRWKTSITCGENIMWN